MTENTGQLGFAFAVGIAVVSYLIWSGRQTQRFMQRLVENHLDHNTAAVSELIKTIAELRNWLGHNGH